MKVVNQNEFNELIQEEGVQLVDFFATWCGPCKMVAPVLDQLEGEMPNVKFAKVDIDESLELAQQYQVTTVPTLAVIKNGKVQERIIGFVPKDQIKSAIEKHIQY